MYLNAGYEYLSVLVDMLYSDLCTYETYLACEALVVFFSDPDLLI